MSPIRVGFVGLSASGWASIAHAGPLLKTGAYTIAAVSTSNPLSASASSEKYSSEEKKVKAYSGDTGAISNDPDVDLVAVSVKTPDHRAAVMPAIAAGKDVFVEWPLGRNFVETKEIAEAARRAGVRSMIGLQGWQSPVVKLAREWITAGKIGRVLSASWIGSKPAEQPYYSPYTVAGGEYTVDPSNGSPTFLSVFIGHNLSVITRILGPLASVSASSARMFNTVDFLSTDGKPYGNTAPNVVPDNYSFSGPLRDHDGALFSGIWRHGIPNDAGRPTLIFLIDGDKGYIKIESCDLSANVVHVVSPSKIVLNGEEHKIEDQMFGNIQRNWEAFAKGESGTWPTFDDAVDVYKHLDAIERSSEEGRRIDVGV
ncbi:NAD(P)-binding protein [Exidia glandulosa HHB12029]|uniref:NAD(P)-binding protein n=1 Tax=Exidia glandulosa HHB12029 TaxID=1314781 RepID=A0A165QD01_EXIGL|nr:NAD(P)-binding protein [Exidia glandulosa HHB12029]